MPEATVELLAMATVTWEVTVAVTLEAMEAATEAVRKSLGDASCHSDGDGVQVREFVVGCLWHRRAL